MTLYFHDNEEFLEYEDAVRQYYSGRIPHSRTVTAIDPRNGEIYCRGSIKQVINDLKYA